MEWRLIDANREQGRRKDVPATTKHDPKTFATPSSFEPRLQYLNNSPHQRIPSTSVKVLQGWELECMFGLYRPEQREWGDQKQKHWGFVFNYAKGTSSMLLYSSRYEHCRPCQIVSSSSRSYICSSSFNTELFRDQYLQSPIRPKPPEI